MLWKGGVASWSSSIDRSENQDCWVTLAAASSLCSAPCLLWPWSPRGLFLSHSGSMWNLGRHEKALPWARCSFRGAETELPVTATVLSGMLRNLPTRTQVGLLAQCDRCCPQSLRRRHLPNLFALCTAWNRIWTAPNHHDCLSADRLGVNYIPSEIDKEIIVDLGSRGRGRKQAKSQRGVNV